MTHVKLSVLIVLAAISMIGCTTTSTTIKEPVFNKSMDSLQVELSTITSSFDNASFSGKEITTNGEKHSELEIEITNGKNVPADENNIPVVAKQIAMLFKNSLQDKNQYNIYRVALITQIVDGLVTHSSTKTIAFTSEELQ